VGRDSPKEGGMITLLRKMGRALGERTAFLGRTIGDEIRHLGHEGSVLFVLVVIPVLYPLVISYLYERNQPQARPAVLVDDDNSALSRELTRHLQALQAIRIDERLPSVDAGWERIRRREAELLVYIPRDFSQDMKKGRQARVILWVDSANILTYGLSYPAVQEAISALNERLERQFFQAKGMPPEAARARAQPIVREERLLFHPSAGYGNFLVPGVFLLAMQQVVLIGLAFSFGLRKEPPQFQPSARFPFTEIEGKFLAQLLVYAAGIAFIVFAVFPLFGWSLKNPVALLTLFGAFLVSLAPLAILVAHLVPDRLAAFQLLMFLSAPLFMMSGHLWPFEQMPAYVRAIASAFPSTPALKAFRVLTMKSGSLADVVPHLAWMGAIFGGWLLVAIVVVRRSWRRLAPQRAAA
jgi:ABC-2 type transport system permease protein